MDSLDKLIELFRQFPGIGPRQARRFVYFLLSQNKTYRESLTETIKKLKDSIEVCKTCHRYFPKGRVDTTECSICRDPNRDNTILLVVSRDVDYENIEKSGNFKGKYFVLGGNIPILEKEPETKIRAKELASLIIQRTKSGLKEVILALNLTPEGENTEEFLGNYLKPLAEKNAFKISKLGRGLSTGLELEYSDSETIKNALKNRS